MGTTFLFKSNQAINISPNRSIKSTITNNNTGLGDKRDQRPKSS